MLVKESEKELFDEQVKGGVQPEDLRLGSIDLIRFLIKQHPDTRFTMLLGADTFADLQSGKWKSGEELVQLVNIVVMQRKGYDAPRLSTGTLAMNESCVTVENLANLGDVSSTAVRAMSSVEELKQVLIPAVADYIIQHKLYAFAESEGDT